MPTMRWRRLEVPGSDACALEEVREGWRLHGSASFGTGKDAATLAYDVACDREWRTLRAEVKGTVGSRPLAITVRRSAGGSWQIGDRPAPQLEGLMDLDLGFTPATNLFPLRRLALRPGQAADAAAAWLDDGSWQFSRLPQRYERRSAREYWYESPATGYAALLTVTADGFVSDYPGLWTAE
jgi:hypothetical protein